MSQGPLSVGESLASTKLVSIVQHLRHRLGDDRDDDAAAAPSSSSPVSQVGVASAMGHVDALAWARVTRRKGYLPHKTHNTHTSITATADDDNDNDLDDGDEEADDADDLPLPSPITVPQLSSKSPLTVPQFTSMRPITVAPLVSTSATTAVGRRDKGLRVITDFSPTPPLAFTPGSGSRPGTDVSMTPTLRTNDNNNDDEGRHRYARGDLDAPVASHSPSNNSPGPSTSPVSFALTVTPRPMASAFSPVLPMQGQGLVQGRAGQATTTTLPASFDFETINNSHHHHHHHNHHDHLTSSAEISVINTSSATSAHLLLSVGGGLTASVNTSTPYASTDHGLLNRAYCDIEVGTPTLPNYHVISYHIISCYITSYHIIANLSLSSPPPSHYFAWAGVRLCASLRRTHTPPHTPAQCLRGLVTTTIATTVTSTNPPRATVLA